MRDLGCEIGLWLRGCGLRFQTPPLACPTMITTWPCAVENKLRCSGPPQLKADRFGPGGCEVRAECRQIQYNHNKREKVQAHGEGHCDVHREDPDQPDRASGARPDKNRVASFQKTDRDSEDRQQIR